MSKKTQQKQLARARAKRDAARQQTRSRNRILYAVVGLVVAVAAVFGVTRLLASDDDTGDDPTAEATAAATASPTAASTPSAEASEPVVAGTEGLCPPPEGAPEADTAMQFDAPPPADDVPDVVQAVIATTCGDITVELDGAGAPQTVANFLFLADQGYYVGTPFHRVMADFVIQGGDPTGTGTGGPGYAIPDELDPIQSFESDPGPCAQDPEEPCFLYPRGTLAMANSGPDSAGSQFFVVQADPGVPWPAAYAAFGTVVDGMDVVDDIANGPVTGPRADQAIDPAVITAIDVAQVE